MSGDNENGAPEEAPLETETAAEAGEETVETLRAEVAALKDRALRALAEAENVRKRAERERDELRRYGIAQFARDLLTVADNLGRALAACPAEARADDTLKAVIEGVEATEREFRRVLAAHGIEPIAAAGEKFDPHLHQAIAQVPAGEQAPGTVVNVVQGGYTIGGRLLRPAMVTVAKGDDASGAGNGPGRSNGGGNGAGGQLDTKI